MTLGKMIVEHDAKASAWGGAMAQAGRSADVFEERDAADHDPFGDVDVSVAVEGSVVRVDEFSVGPVFGLFADFESVQDFRPPSSVVTEVHD